MWKAGVMTKLNNPVTVETDIGGRKLKIETGRFAKQAHGSVFIQYGETTALVTVVCAKEAKPDIDFFPLTIEFQEKYYSSGKIPGGYFKREAKPTEWATLNARMVDRPLRPLFPDGFRNETQIVITLLSYDGETEPETIAGLGASTALLISDVPFDNPIATVRVGRIDGKFVINPKASDLAKSDISVLVSATKNDIVMVEGGANHVSEEDFLNALFFGFEQAQVVIALQEKLRAVAGKTKRVFTPAPKDEALAQKVKDLAEKKLYAAFEMREKQKRYGAIDATKTETLAAFTTGITDESQLKKIKTNVVNAFEDLKYKVARDITFKSGKRIDGREYNQIRSIETEAKILPRVHGSALFTRGETQALVTVTLGSSDDEQTIDTALGKVVKKFLLHYNFPPFSVGEVGRFGGNSRREVGHGVLAERAVTSIIPTHDKFPYTIRVVSEVLESNGSSSMASVCGASMALMDAGVPVTSAVAGIAMGLMKENNQVVVLSDILGDEDHLGDMDFKVCGTTKGVTAVQMDIKMDGVSREIMQKAMLQAREGRLHILKEMEKAISTSRTEISEFAPRMTLMQISQDRIKDLIGPGGKNIKAIVAATGVKIDIEDSGKVSIFSTDPSATAKAVDMVKGLTDEAEIGKIYMGTVVRIADFGAFVEIMPGTDGLVHISELAHHRVQTVNEVVQEGDQIPVKVLEIDRQGRIRLSRKAAISAPTA